MLNTLQKSKRYLLSNPDKINHFTEKFLPKFIEHFESLDDKEYFIEIWRICDDWRAAVVVK